MKKLKLFTLSTLFIFTFSCNSENNEVTQKDEKSIIVNSLSQKPASNIDNPFENIGVLHNQFLAQMNVKNISDDFIYTSSLSFVESHGYNTDMISIPQLQNIVDQALTTEPTQDNLDALAVTYNLSDSYKNELNKLFLFLNYQNYSSVNEIQSRLINIEVEYMNAPVTNVEKESLLGIVAIARYSTEYWINRLPNDRPSTLLKGKWFLRIIGGIAGDVLGAAVGGFVAGAASLGTLAIPGMFVGAIAGSTFVQKEISKSEI